MGRLVVLVVALTACRPPGWGKEHQPDASETTDGTTENGDAAIDSPVAATCDHAFRLEGYGSASTAWVTGDFVAWAGTPPAAVELALGGNGVWTGSYQFMAGPHQYKFIVSGAQWIPDPGNPDTVPDGLGGQNSVFTCVP